MIVSLMEIQVLLLCVAHRIQLKNAPISVCIYCTRLNMKPNVFLMHMRNGYFLIQLA